MPRHVGAVMRWRDLIAGLSVAGLMLPEAVAYAGIAGLPPQRAILAAIVGALIYGLVGRSRFAIVSPTSSSAAILGAAIAALSIDPASGAAVATMAVALVGLLFIAASILRLGGLTSFIARPVLRGFAFGLAITIIVKQIPILAGLKLHGADIAHLVWAILNSLPQWHVASVLTGVLALAGLLALRRLPMIPGALLVICAGIAASLAFDLPGRGVAVVGTIDLVPSIPRLPSVSWATMVDLAAVVAALFLVLFAESWGTMRALALRHGDTLAANRELSALGLANLGSALVQGMPVGAGFSAGAASESAGAVTRATGAVAAIGLALLMLLAAPMIAHLPEPVLAAVVITALIHALDPRPFFRLWTLRRDQYIWLGAALGVLVLGVVNGMLFAIALSLAVMVHRMVTPRLERLGRLGTSHDYVDVARHPDAVRQPDLAVWRPIEPLFFANAETILVQIVNSLAEEPAIRTVVLSLERTADLDSTALDALLEFDQQLRARDITLRLARVRDDIKDMLTAAGAAELAMRTSYSVDDAVAGIYSGP